MIIFLQEKVDVFGYAVNVQQELYHLYSFLLLSFLKCLEGMDGKHTICLRGRYTKMKLTKAFKLRKAKYTKRTGSPGNFKYFYGEEVDKKKKGELEKKERKGKLQGEEKFDAIKSIVKNKQHGKVNGQPLDVQTANLLTTVADNLSEKNRKVYLEMPITKMVNVAFKLRERGAIK